MAAAGSHAVAFSYRPEHLTLSLWLCAGGFSLLLLNVAREFGRASDTANPDDFSLPPGPANFPDY